MRRTVAAVLLCLACVAASGQDQPPADADPTVEIRNAYKAAKSANAEVDAAPEKKKEECRKKARAAWDKFIAGFSKVEWSAWDLKDDLGLLGDGLSSVGSRAYSDAGDYALAVKAWEFLLDNVPDHVSAKYVTTMYLPDGYAASGQLDRGVAGMRRYVDRMKSRDAADAYFALGDLLAASGDTDAAKKAYADAAAAYEKRPRGDDSAKATIEFKSRMRRLIGSPVPQLRVGDCVGGKPVPLSSFSGRTVLLCAFTAQKMAGTDVLKGFESLHKRLSSKGMTVLGVTSFESLSPMTLIEDTVEVKMPRNPDDREGETVKVSRATFHKHLETYRQRMKISFPLLVADSKSLEELTGSSIVIVPQRFVVDPRQIIVHASDDPLWHGTIGIAESVCLRNAPPPAGGQAPK